MQLKLHQLARGKETHFDLKLEAHTSIENDPPMIKLIVNDAVAFEAPLVIVDEIIKMLETAKAAIKTHNI